MAITPPQIEPLAGHAIRTAPFTAFCAVAEAVRQTTKRLEKAALLAAYFNTLGDADLRWAARFFGSSSFTSDDGRKTNVGGAAVLAALEAVTGATSEAIRARYVGLGDLGDVAFETLSASEPGAPSLTIQGIIDSFNEIAATSGSKAKLALVTALFGDATAIELKYLVKLLLGDLRIGLQEGAVEDAIARWKGVPIGQVQWANMLVGDIGETAVLARMGGLGAAKMRPFHAIKFMLATPAADLADVARQMPNPFVVEDKYDGIRAQAHVQLDDGTPYAHGVIFDGRRVALFSRTSDDITASFPDLLAPLSRLVLANAPISHTVILDGEILPVRGERILAFQQLQQRLGRKAPTDAMIAQVPVAFMAYDCLHHGVDLLIDRPFAERRAALVSLPSADGVQISASVLFEGVEPLDQEFAAARQRGNEGLMVKDPASPYRPGRRGREWLKIKRALATLDVVVTAVEVGNGKRSHLLSDYTFAVRASEADPTLLNVGKAYSGLTDAELAEMSEWFRAHTLQEFAHGKVRIVEPTVVIEVTFDAVQPSARHKSGYALRFPRILRIRDDKPASEADTLSTVKSLADLSAAKNAEP